MAEALFNKMFTPKTTNDVPGRSVAVTGASGTYHLAICDATGDMPVYQ